MSSQHYLTLVRVTQTKSLYSYLPCSYDCLFILLLTHQLQELTAHMLPNTFKTSQVPYEWDNKYYLHCPQIFINVWLVRYRLGRLPQLVCKLAHKRDGERILTGGSFFWEKKKKQVGRLWTCTNHSISHRPVYSCKKWFLNIMASYYVITDSVHDFSNLVLL